MRDEVPMTSRGKFTSGRDIVVTKQSKLQKALLQAKVDWRDIVSFAAQAFRSDDSTGVLLLQLKQRQERVLVVVDLVHVTGQRMAAIKIPHANHCHPLLRINSSQCYVRIGDVECEITLPGAYWVPGSEQVKSSGGTNPLAQQ